MHNESEKEISARFIGSSFCIDRNGNPKINVFVKRDKEAGLSVWDISKYIKSNDERSIFKIGDKNFAKKPPYTIARCDLERNDVDKTFKTIESKFNNHEELDSDDQIAILNRGICARCGSTKGFRHYDTKYKSDGSIEIDRNDICLNEGCKWRYFYSPEGNIKYKLTPLKERQLIQ